MNSEQEGEQINFISAIRRVFQPLLDNDLLWLLSLVVYTILLTFKTEIASGFKLNDQEYRFFVAWVGLGLISSTFILIFKYLRGTLGSNDARHPDSLTMLRRLHRMEDNVAAVMKQVSSHKSEVNITDSEREQLLKDAFSSFNEHFSEEFLTKSIDEKFIKSRIRETQISQISNELNVSKARVNSEIRSLSRRADINLGIGCVTTLAAAGILYFSIYNSPVKLGDLTSILNYFIPRISIVVFIEVFSFFFLRLYRGNLLDVKYYQNELTNIESKFLALRVGLINEDKELLHKVSQSLYSTERNFILKKSETTVGIETAKFQHSNDKSFVDNFKSIIDSLPKLTATK